MQIDFHHAVTYVVGRLAGFSPEDAGIVAHAAQYVDDATNSGEIRFENGAMYSRIASAHKMLDYRNAKSLENARVWIPFHFLPGNGGLQAGQNPEGSFIRKLICRPNSPVAQDMVQHCIDHHDTPYALHRLGITMHVYADTWAHQGFAGVNHTVNEVHEVTDDDGGTHPSLLQRAKTWIGDAIERLEADALSHVPLGHGAALGFPDMPFLSWTYTNGLGEKIVRNNPEQFLAAVKHMFAAMVHFRRARGATETDLPSAIPSADLRHLEEKLRTLTDRDGEDRHRAWCAAIAEGAFSFGKEEPTYVAKGRGSWKFQALGTEDDEQTRDDGFRYSPAFLTSHWKRFHDALQIHRVAVLYDILPRYGITVA